VLPITSGAREEVTFSQFAPIHEHWCTVCTVKSADRPSRRPPRLASSRLCVRALGVISIPVVSRTVASSQRTGTPWPVVRRRSAANGPEPSPADRVDERSPRTDPAPRPDVRPAPSCRIAGGDPPAPETSSLAAVGDSECRAPMPPSSAERTMGLAQRYLSRRGWRVLFAVPDGGRSSLAPGFRPGRWGLLLRGPFEHGAALQWCLRRNSWICFRSCRFWVAVRESSGSVRLSRKHPDPA